MNYYSFLKPLLYWLSPETAHHLAIWSLKHKLLPKAPRLDQPELKQTLWGINFSNPVGMAAGFDKNAEAISGLWQQGFGFVEVGTVTPKPQPGNPKPRLFRLTEDEAVINRFGFNNKGIAPFVENLKQRSPDTLVGANIGKNKTSEDAIADYITTLQQVYDVSDYITINISSPNTPGLRDLQKSDYIGDLLTALTEEKKQLEAATGITTPLFLKIAPDMEDGELESMAESIMKHTIDAVIISNTSISIASKLSSPHAHETGGISGKPLMELSTQQLKRFYKLTNGAIPLIGVGGITSAEDAYTKIKAGASLIQVYSALVYQGFGLVSEICNTLPILLHRDGFKNVSEAIGVDA